MFNPYDFYLPKHLIAQYPLINRTESRLLNCLLPDLQDQYFYNLVDILTENDILVLNNTRVIPSLLHGTINNKTVSINLKKCLFFK